MRRACRRAGIVAGIVLVWCACASALDPSLNISQYAHTAWKARDGFFKSGITPIAQTADGYLWLGTDFGLLRFDGVRFVAWQPPGNEHLPSNAIAGLLVSSDGTLWIGTQKGLASWKDSRLNHYSELDGQLAFRFLEDQEHTIWVGSIGIPTGRLCMGVVGLYEDSKRNLWVGVSEGALALDPGPVEVLPNAGGIKLHPRFYRR